MQISAGGGRGKWYRFNRKQVQESVDRFSIFDLRRVGALDGELKTGTIGRSEIPFAIQPPLMLLHYKGKDVFITLTSTNPHMGGKRWWFACPECNRRCGVMYMRLELLACRLCHDLTYESRNRLD